MVFSPGLDRTDDVTPSRVDKAIAVAHKAAYGLDDIYAREIYLALHESFERLLTEKSDKFTLKRDVQWTEINKTLTVKF